MSQQFFGSVVLKCINYGKELQARDEYKQAYKKKRILTKEFLFYVCFCLSPRTLFSEILETEQRQYFYFQKKSYKFSPCICYILFTLWQ